MQRQSIQRIVVHPVPGRQSRGILHVGTVTFACALGRSGIRRAKREGDGATPLADLPLRRLFYRADRLSRPSLPRPIRRIRTGDAWCDDPSERRYNRLIHRDGEHEETLRRADNLYDIIVELGWNDDPPRRGMGSAIFWHVARPGFTPTAGCVAIRRGDFAKILQRLAPNCVVEIRHLPTFRPLRRTGRAK